MCSVGPVEIRAPACAAEALSEGASLVGDIGLWNGTGGIRLVFFLSASGYMQQAITLMPPPPYPRKMDREAGSAGGIGATIALLRGLGDCRDVQENACWLLALLSQVAEFSRR